MRTRLRDLDPVGQVALRGGRAVLMADHVDAHPAAWRARLDVLADLAGRARDART